jgi:hypothetical protein
LTFLACVLLMACGAGPEATLDWNAAPQPTAAPNSSLLPLEVWGTELRTSHGPLRLRGLNVCSLEFDREGRTWALGADGSALLASLAEASGWKANVVRMPVNQQWFLEDDGYVQRVEALIDDAAVRGLYVVLDVQWEHGERTEPYYENILEVPTFGTGNTTEAFWLKASSRWANRTNLLFDLINEPHGRPEAEVRAALQTLIDAIRLRTLQPIVIGGPDWAHSLEPWQREPLRGEQLIYSAHQYLPWDRPADFEVKWKRPAQTLPVIIGEFLATPAHVDYARQLITEAEASGVDGWMPWAIGCGLSADISTELEGGAG